MSPLLLLLLAESAALVVALYLLILRAPTHPSTRPEAKATPTQPSSRAVTEPGVEPELAKKTKELSDAKTQISDLREQLKRAKRERFDQRQSSRDEQSLAKERELVERTASQQLEAVRAELAHALNELNRVKSDSALPRERRTTLPAQPSVTVASAAPSEALPPKTRELSATDLAKMERAERKAMSERARSAELERDLKRVKGKAEMHSRLYLVMKGEVELVRDKFKALEKRLNRTLLERDVLLRAIRQLEKESGKVAERTELTAEEMEASDARTEATQRAEAKALSQAQPAAAPETGTEEIIPKANA